MQVILSNIFLLVMVILLGVSASLTIRDLKVSLELNKTLFEVRDNCLKLIVILEKRIMELTVEKQEVGRDK